MRYPEGDPRNEKAMVEVYESIYEFEYRETNIRVWREEESFTAACNAKHDDILLALSKADPMTLQGTAAVLHIQPRVTAYQISTSGGRGVVVYTDWP